MKVGEDELTENPAAGKTRRFWIAGSILGLAAFSLSLFSTAPYGVGVSPDSVAYISAARNFVAGNGLTCYDGRPFVSWPPLYPIILSVFEFLRIDLLIASRFVAAAAWGTVVVLLALWLRRNLRHPVLIWIGALSVLFSEPLLLVNVYAWSDGLFVIWVILFLWHLERLLDCDSRLNFVGIVVFAALACLTRFVGITLIITGGILLLSQNNVLVMRRVVRASLFTALSSLPVGLWIARSVLVSGSPTGPRFPTESNLLIALGHTIGTLSEWFLPSVLGIALLAYVARRFGGGEHPARETRYVVRVALTFAAIYVMFLVTSESLIGHDKIGHRFLAPIYPVLLILLLGKLDRHWGNRSGSEGHRPRKLIIAGMVLWLAWPITETMIKVENHRASGLGTFTSRTWHESGLIRSLSEFPVDGTLLSNAPDAIYLWTGIDASFTPHADLTRTLDPEKYSLGTFRKTISADAPVYIAWFHSIGRPYLFSVEELETFCELNPVREFTDGIIFSARRAATSGRKSEPD